MIHHETFLALCRHRPTAKLKADVADRVLHPADRNITDKGGKVRKVLLLEIVSRSLLSLGGDAGANDPVFASRNGGGYG
jgi:hypothetical protein